MKITVETTVGGAYNAETEGWDTFDALTVGWQAGKGTKRTSTTFAFPSDDAGRSLGYAAKACRAAAAYFEAQLSASDGS